MENKDQVTEITENGNKSSDGKKTLKKSSIIGYIVSILCLLLCLYITIEVINANTNNRPPRIFGLSISYVPTTSMEPTIDARSYILFKQADIDDFKAGSGTAEENHTNMSGDIVIYYSSLEDKYIVHRVVETGEDEEGKYLIVWGDNNLTSDTDNDGVLKVRDSMIYGKFVTTVGILSILSGGTNTNVIFFILVIIFVIMIGMQVAQIFIKNKTNDIKKKQQEQKDLLREEMKRQILEEEIAKLKAQTEALKKNKQEESQEAKVEDTTPSDESAE